MAVFAAATTGTAMDVRRPGGAPARSTDLGQLQGASKAFGARCGLPHGDRQLGLITPKDRRAGRPATVRASGISTNNSLAAEATVDLHAPKVEWQHVVPVTGLQANKTSTLEVVFDGCVGPVSVPSTRRVPRGTAGSAPRPPVPAPHPRGTLAGIA